MLWHEDPTRGSFRQLLAWPPQLGCCRLLVAAPSFSTVSLHPRFEPPTDSLRPRFESSTDSLRPRFEPAGAPAGVSFHKAVTSELDKRLVYPTLKRGLPLLQKLPVLMQARASKLRAELADALLSDDPVMLARTADLVRPNEPPLFGAWMADRAAVPN